MQEQIITCETLLLAKQKGCGLEMDSGLFIFVDEYGEEFVCNYNKKGSTPEITMTQSLIQKWLREKHKTIVLVLFETIDDSETAYTFSITKEVPEGKGRKKDTWDFYDRYFSFNQGGGWYNTYEEALEEGLKQALKTL